MSTSTTFLSQVREASLKCPSPQRFRDYLSVAKNEGTLPDILTYIEDVKQLITRSLTTTTQSDLTEYMLLQKRALLIAAPQHFDSYLQYVEWDREPKRSFYLPRRKQLLPVVNALQELAEDKADLVCISLPPGSGKSSLAIFYMTWLAGRNPDAPILGASHSNAFIRGVYDECLRILDAHGEYLWHDVFPTQSVSSTNAKDCRIDIGRRKRFETLEFTSIGTGNAGLYRAVQLLYCDDLVSGLEVALSKERLDKLWEVYTTDLRQRKMSKCKELHIATRWSVHDVIGRLEDKYGSDPRARFIVIPALNEADESNFDYLYGVGFTTEAYHKQREIMDDVSWKALFMNQPVEREGLLYPEDELQRFFDLPDTPPDAILAACDTKDRGSDYCVMPIVYQYGRNYYVADIVCSDAAPEVVDELLIQALLTHKVQMARFESNSAGGRVAKTVQEAVKKRGGITKITTKYTVKNKETKILMASPFVKERFFFLDQSKQSRTYQAAMRMITSYTLAGRNKHDDTVDALAQLAEFVQSFDVSHLEVIQRPW